MGRRRDARPGVFGLGVVPSRMLPGHLPFPGSTPLERIRAVLHQDPVPMARFNPRAPTALQRILERALAKDPADRHQTMAALRDELKALERRLARDAAAGGATARVPGRVPRPWAALGAGLGRVFGRRREEHADPEGPTPMRPPPARTAVPAPPPSRGAQTKPTLAPLP